MIYQEVSERLFRQAFTDYGRGDNFSHEGLGALYDFLNDGEDIELDIIAICCEFSEYSIEEIRSQFADVEDMEEDDEVLDWLEEQTTVIRVNDTMVIIANF